MSHDSLSLKMYDYEFVEDIRRLPDEMQTLKKLIDLNTFIFSFPQWRFSDGKDRVKTLHERMKLIKSKMAPEIAHLFVLDVLILPYEAFLQKLTTVRSQDLKLLLKQLTNINMKAVYRMFGDSSYCAQFYAFFASQIETCYRNPSNLTINDIGFSIPLQFYNTPVPKPSSAPVDVVEDISKGSGFIPVDSSDFRTMQEVPPKNPAMNIVSGTPRRTNPLFYTTVDLTDGKQGTPVYDEDAMSSATLHQPDLRPSRPPPQYHGHVSERRYLQPPPPPPTSSIPAIPQQQLPPQDPRYVPERRDLPPPPPPPPSSMPAIPPQQQQVNPSIVSDQSIPIPDGNYKIIPVHNSMPPNLPFMLPYQQFQKFRTVLYYLDRIPILIHGNYVYFTPLLQSETGSPIIASNGSWIYSAWISGIPWYYNAIAHFVDTNYQKMAGHI